MALYSPGLVGIEYNGYFDGNPNWFSSASPTGITESRSEFYPVSPTPNNGYSWEWTGYFKPLSAEGFIEDDFIFTMNSDDIGIMWIGNVAASGYTTTNRLVSAYGYDQSSPISLRADTYYPVRIQYGHPVPPTTASLYIQANPQIHRMANDFVAGCLFTQSTVKTVRITGKTKLLGKVNIAI
jgi:hypothetical protein